MVDTVSIWTRFRLTTYDFFVGLPDQEKFAKLRLRFAILTYRAVMNHESYISDY